MALHGKKQRMAVGGYDVSCLGHNIRLSMSKELAPSDTFCEEEHLSEPGTRSSNYSFEGRLKANNDAINSMVERMKNDIEDSPYLLYAPEGWVNGSRVFMTETNGSNIDVSGDMKSVTNIAGGFQANGGTLDGYLLVSPAGMLTVTGSGVVVDLGAYEVGENLNGYRLQLHTVEVGDDDAAIEVTVLHSDASDKSGGTVIGTFTVTNETGSEVVLSADDNDPLKRYVWASWTIAGGVTPEFRIAVALSDKRGTEL